MVGLGERKFRVRRQYTDPHCALAMAVIESAWREAEKNLTAMRTTRDDLMRQQHLKSVAANFHFLRTSTLYHQVIDLDPRSVVERFRLHVDEDEYGTIKRMADDQVVRMQEIRDGSKEEEEK